MNRATIESLARQLAIVRIFPQQKLLELKPEVSDNKLELSRMDRDATSDETLADLQSVVTTRLAERPLKTLMVFSPIGCGLNKYQACSCRDLW